MAVLLCGDKSETTSDDLRGKACCTRGGTTRDSGRQTRTKKTASVDFTNRTLVQALHGHGLIDASRSVLFSIYLCPLFLALGPPITKSWCPAFGFVRVTPDWLVALSSCWKIGVVCSRAIHHPFLRRMSSNEIARYSASERRRAGACGPPVCMTYIQYPVLFAQLAETAIKGGVLELNESHALPRCPYWIKYVGNAHKSQTF